MQQPPCTVGEVEEKRRVSVPMLLRMALSYAKRGILIRVIEVRIESYRRFARRE